MGSRFTTLLALWQEMFRREHSSYWQPGLDNEMSAVALWHCCPRCLTMSFAALGRATRCERCGLVSENQFRRVVIHTPEQTQQHDWVKVYIGRLGDLANGLRCLHPAQLPPGTTHIELEKWTSFTDSRTSWDTEAPK